MKIYDSLQKKKVDFIPENNTVNMYVCGPTVYADIHIGNARPLVFFDVVNRYLKLCGYEVNFACNVTDIDDKIIMQAQRLAVSEEELTKLTTDNYVKILEQLDINFTYMPKVTQYMEEIVKFIEQLIKLDYAYEKNGSVYFRVSKVKDYGKLSNRELERMQAGIRVAINEAKEYEHDFILWKATAEGIKWSSPFSLGRPGWHTECVVMIRSIFNQTIDIHGGGQDLMFPHHENEIAQSCACQEVLAKHWMHNGFINFDNEKMSKSLGNVLLVKDLLQKYSPNFLRLLLLQTKYRSPINLNEQFFSQTQNILSKFESIAAVIETGQNFASDNEHIATLKAYFEDDFNTSNVIDYLLNLLKVPMNEQINAAFEFGFSALGLNFVKKEVLDLPNEIAQLIELRQKYKEERNYVKADEIRAKILASGYEIKDTKNGVEWQKI